MDMQLTAQGTQRIEEIAQRYNLSVEAVMTMLQAVMNGNGTMAQFSHPELGGTGQWMQGGMTMVGDMFNYTLKALVDNLCTELSGLLASQSLLMPAAPSQRQTQGAGGDEVSLFVSGGGHGAGWWPADLGMPSATGSQNNLRYAIFPASHRLATDINGQITVYDTLNHQIGGIGQQQGQDASFTFTSQFGLVRIADLPLVSGVGGFTGTSSPPQGPAGVGQPFAAPMVSEEAPGPMPTSPIPMTREEEVDVFTKIERLAELHQRGILSNEEFVAKKTELLGRL
jgi:hypothetical protein